jgi:squalene synthase HpnC
VSEFTECEAADAYCRLLARSHYENFDVVSGVLLRGKLAVDLRRIYAYCRTTDDLGDESGSHALERLESWRAQVVELFAGETPVHPVLLALGETVAQRRMNAQPFLDLIEANVMDQRVSVYETWADLRAYCELSAAPVGRMVLAVFGMNSTRAQLLSDDVCIGLQLANHAQDVARDRTLGRTYLTQADLREGGCAFAVRALCERARKLLASGVELESMAPFVLRVQLALYRLGGLAIVRAIEREGFRTDVRRPTVSKATKILILARACLQSLGSRHDARELEVA